MKFDIGIYIYFRYLNSISEYTFNEKKRVSHTRTHIKIDDIYFLLQCQIYKLLIVKFWNRRRRERSVNTDIENNR